MYKDLFRFKSTKTNQVYFVWVEVYDFDCHALKFHLKAHTNSPNKYRLLSGLGEAIPVINTCIRIVKHIAGKDRNAIFGFVGESSLAESEKYTKRYRLYRKFMHFNFSEQEWVHIDNPLKSSYLIIPKHRVEQDPSLITSINDKFRSLYSYFD